MSPFLWTDERWSAISSDRRIGSTKIAADSCLWSSEKKWSCSVDTKAPYLIARWRESQNMLSQEQRLPAEWFLLVNESISLSDTWTCFCVIWEMCSGEAVYIFTSCAVLQADWTNGETPLVKIPMLQIKYTHLHFNPNSSPSCNSTLSFTESLVTGTMQSITRHGTRNSIWKLDT